MRKNCCVSKWKNSVGKTPIVNRRFRMNCGFTLIEVLIAISLLCIAVISALQFLGYCILLDQKARSKWHSAIEKWNVSRQIRSDPKAIEEMEFSTIPGFPGLYSIEIGNGSGDSKWEILTDEPRN